MICTVFVTWGCQLGGGNEKACILMVPPSLGVGAGVEAVLVCALAIEGRASAPAAAMPKDARSSERLVGWVIDVSFLFERLAGWSSGRHGRGDGYSPSTLVYNPG